MKQGNENRLAAEAKQEAIAMAAEEKAEKKISEADRRLCLGATT